MRNQFPVKPLAIGIIVVVLVLGGFFAYKYDQRFRRNCVNNLHGRVISHTQYWNTSTTTYDRKGRPSSGNSTTSTTTTECINQYGTVLDYES